MIQVFQYSEEQKEQKAGQQQQTVIPASGVEGKWGCEGGGGGQQQQSIIPSGGGV